MKDVKGWQLPEWDNHYEKMLKEFDGKWEYQHLNHIQKT